MAVEPFRKIYVICEGLSEVAYLSQWNALLRERDVRCSFSPMNAEGCSPRKLKGKMRERRWEKRDIKYFLIDRDQFSEAHAGLAGLGTLLLNTQNFEDFLSLHLPFEQAAEWCGICVEHGHFKHAMRADDYEPLFQGVFQRRYSYYRKGHLPTGFVCEETIDHLKSNYGDPRLQQARRHEDDFACFLVEKILPMLSF